MNDTTTISHLFPSSSKVGKDVLSNGSGKSSRLLRWQFTEDDFKKNVSKQGGGKKTVEFLDDSDEEFKWELEEAVKMYKKNKPEDKSKPSKKMPTPRNKEMRSNIGKDPPKTEKNLSTERIGNGDAFTDITELINYFFVPDKIQKCGQNFKSYSDYEKQGAIPKSKVTNVSNENNRIEVKDLIERVRSRRKNRSESILNKTNDCLSDSIPTGQTSNPHGGNEIVTVNEETCAKPFFYIVPENPSPNFSLPRGSYYVTPAVHTASTEESIVFHPERGAHSEFPVECSKTCEIQPECGQTNDLDKDAEEKLDSHLNIGPRDVKLNESTYNLEISCTASKVYQKHFASIRNSQNGPTSPSEEFGLEVSGEGFVDNGSGTNKKYEETLNDLIKYLTGEFPHWSTTWSSYVGQKFVNDQQGLQQFLASERLEIKIQKQFERLVSILPEISGSELLRKCKEFKGDEKLLDEFVKEEQLNKRICQRITDMQFIFPDADPEFLSENVRKFGDDDEELSRFTDELLESKDYPKAPAENQVALRRRLWNTYVKNFSFKNYLREVPNPERFAGPNGDNNGADAGLILTYLRARYSSANLDLLQVFRNNNCNLTKTCDYLNSIEKVTPLGNSLQNHPFSEELLKEISFIEHKKEIEAFVKQMRELKELEREEASENMCFLYCPLCSDSELVASEVVPCPEGHVFCIECIKRYISVKIGDGVYKFSCPTEQCDSWFTFGVLEGLLPEKTLLNIVRKQQAQEVNSADLEGLEFCPCCEFAYIPNPGDNIFKCQNTACLRETCRKCGEKNHIPLRCEEIERPIDVEARKRIEETMTLKLIRKCPSCKKNIVKVDGCNKMVCTCGTYFCYLCRNQIVPGYSHFSSGCPLYSNNDQLHNEDVVAEGVRTLNEILQENPSVRILYDPRTATL